MKYSLSAVAAALTLIGSPVAATTWRGFNLGANKADGSCKGVADYTADFKAIQSWATGFNAVRLYSTSDCATLDNALPAAKATGMKLLVGVWANDQNHFEAEKAALWRLINYKINGQLVYGVNYIAAVTVGSEDLYRKDLDPNTLASRIGDVRGMIQQPSVPGGSNIQVGHVDTWTAWVDPVNDVVTRACDFVVTDGYPYWQGTPIANAKDTFYQSVNAVKGHIAGVKNQPVWVGETGWPTGGLNFGSAVPGTRALQRYWTAVACQLFKDNTNFFWYSAFDSPTSEDKYNVEKHFGVAYAGRTLKIQLHC